MPEHVLELSWVDGGFAWWDPTEPDIAGSQLLTLLPSQIHHPAERPPEVVGRALPEADDRSVTMALVPVPHMSQMLLGAAPDATWSESLHWVHQAVLTVVELIASGRLLPALRPHDGRWLTTWNPILDSESLSLLAALDAQAPRHIFFFDPDGTETVVRSLFDSLCRSSLRKNRWQPGLPGSRSTTAMSLRRFAESLHSVDDVFVTDSLGQGAVAEELSQKLDAVHTRFKPELGDRVVASLREPHLGVGTWHFDVEMDEGDDASSYRVLQLLRPYVPEVAKLAKERATNFSVELDDEQVVRIIDSIEALSRSGLEVSTPDTVSTSSLRVTSAVRTDRPRRSLESVLLDVDWGLALGGIDLTEEEIDHLAAESAELISLRGQWVRIEEHAKQAALKHLKSRREDSTSMTAADLLRLDAETLAGSSDESASVHLWIDQVLADLPDTDSEPVEEPDNFVGELRGYQREALAWLHFLGEIGLGGCLADDMGLGKTPTTLAHLLGRSNEAQIRRPHLVICPLSVVTNWESESHRFSPDLEVLVAHGSNRPEVGSFLERAVAHDLVITTYGTAVRVVDQLAEVPWDVVVCDEAQAIKNQNTHAARMVRALTARQKLALTGTPVENRLSDLWAILDALNPGMLGGPTWFRSKIASPIENHRDPEALATLHRLTGPFVLRRSKSDRTLLPDLPDKIEQIAWAPLSTEQVGLYRAVLDEMMSTINEKSGIERRGLVLATLTKLKQVCNHPAHFLGEPNLGDTGRSGKLDRLDELLDNIIDVGDRTLLFTQYRVMGDLLSTHLSERLDTPIPFLHGGSSLAQRTNMVDTFQSGEGPPVQIISLRAGGTGLNLTAANRVIHYDRWWNPAVETQASDRTWRIGQTRTVFVHALVTRGTLEEHVTETLERKRQLADDAFDAGGEAWLTELSAEELRGVLELNLETVGAIE